MPGSRNRGALVVLLALAGCQGLGDRESLQASPPANTAAASGSTPPAAVAPDAGGQVADAGVAAPDGGDPYLVMCRHYCDALDQTWLYVCLSSGTDAAACAAASSSDLCFQDRCAPRFVQPALCFTQCDALDRAYRGVCGGAGRVSPETCPLSPDAHDAACRGGCALPADDAGSDGSGPG
jgi:hypothetical protein